MYRKKENIPFLGERLRLLRETNGMTQQQMADALHLERCTYTFYEIGRTRPDLGTLLRIARIFNISVDDLIDPDYNTLDSMGKHVLLPESTTDPFPRLRRKREQRLLALFRQMNDTEQERFLHELDSRVEKGEINRKNNLQTKE